MMVYSYQPLGEAQPSIKRLRATSFTDGDKCPHGNSLGNPFTQRLTAPSITLILKTQITEKQNGN